MFYIQLLIETAYCRLLCISNRLFLISSFVLVSVFAVLSASVFSQLNCIKSIGVLSFAPCVIAWIKHIYLTCSQLVLSLVAIESKIALASDTVNSSQKYSAVILELAITFPNISIILISFFSFFFSLLVVRLLVLEDIQ